MTSQFLAVHAYQGFHSEVRSTSWRPHPFWVRKMKWQNNSYHCLRKMKTLDYTDSPDRTSISIGLKL